MSWFREFRPHISGNMFWTLGGFNESYLVHFDSHFAFENGAFFQLPGFNLTGEGLEEPFAIREGIIIPAGTYNNIDWEFRANTNRGAPLSVSAGWELGGFYASYSFTPRLYVQTNVQYNDDTKDLGTNVRVGWLDTAGTGLFLVWNDTNHTGSLERTGILAGPKQRQLVVKYSRLLNLRG